MPGRSRRLCSSTVAVVLHTAGLLIPGLHAVGLHAAEPIEGVGPVGPVRRVATGFTFTEGPAYRDGVLYFTDIPNERIHTVDADGLVGMFVEGSRHANGLMFRPTGELLACEMDGRLVEYDTATTSRRVLAAEHAGVRFNAPNDLVIDSHGGVYFTDPRFRAPEPFPQGGQHAYYLAKDGAVTRLTRDLPAPNGILLSRDEKTLYVLPSRGPVMFSYRVDAPGRVSQEREFYRVRQPEPGGRGGSDGAALDTRGNLYLTTRLGVQVVSEQGEHLGVIPVPEKPTNVTFGGPANKTLFITARTSVYAADLEVAGWRFGGTR